MTGPMRAERMFQLAMDVGDDADDATSLALERLIEQLHGSGDDVSAPSPATKVATWTYIGITHRCAMDRINGSPTEPSRLDGFKRLALVGDVEGLAMVAARTAGVEYHVHLIAEVANAIVAATLDWAADNWDQVERWPPEPA